ncbi:MAG: amino acid ABC transporter substrate-binding protein, partial [Leptolyngbya sp. RL_3_1]|nr:amino acid ABC transporter substrate-binding protein [Leptolyngbya sp. RL_3_1]
MQQTLGVQTNVDLITVKPGQLSIVTSNIAARPMSFMDEGQRLGYEPAVARAVCERMGLEPVWSPVPLQDFYTELSKGEYDVIWFNQVITQERRAWADFTRPYGRFDTAVLVKEESAIETKRDLRGQRVGMLQGSTTHLLLEMFPPDIEVVSFAEQDQVLAQMLQALYDGRIDAIVEDELFADGGRGPGPGLTGGLPGADSASL